MEIKLLRSQPETGAKSTRLRPSAREWTAEAVKGSLFCFKCVSIARETRRGGTRGVTFRLLTCWGAESSPGGLCCEDSSVYVKEANPQTHFISLFFFFGFWFLVFFFYILSPFAIRAYPPMPGWMLPGAGAGTAYGVNSQLGRAGLSPKPKPFQNSYRCK